MRRFLDSNMRLRTACELELSEGEKSIQVKRTGRIHPAVCTESGEEVGDLIKKCKPQFADPTVTELTWNKP